MSIRKIVPATVEFAALSNVENWRGLLTDEEKAKAAGLSNPVLKARFAIGRGLRRKMLSGVAGIAPPELRFQESSDGKPRVENADGWDFNVSHSGDWVAAAVAQVAVGIDIEMMRPVREMESIAARYFHPDEAVAWRALVPGLREEAFFVLWSAREAAMKCRGFGLAKGLAVTRVGPEILWAAEAPARVGEVEVLVRRVEVPRGYVGMVALASGGR